MLLCRIVSALMICSDLILSASCGKCFNEYLPCKNSSQKICATDKPHVEFRRETEVETKNATCLDLNGFLLCSWRCSGISSCVGFNFIENKQFNRLFSFCQIFLDEYPAGFEYSSNCSFFRVSTNTIRCASLLYISGATGLVELSLPATSTPLLVTNKWIVLHQRIDAAFDFNQNWDAYKNGFGVPGENFWLGLEKIRQLVKDRSCSTKFEVLTQRGHIHVDEYSSFSLSDESSGYTLSVGGYIGNNTDVINYAPYIYPSYKHNGMKFSTNDVDNDPNPREDCAKTRLGGWWYHMGCDSTKLHGQYSSRYVYYVREVRSSVLLKNSRMSVKFN